MTGSGAASVPADGAASTTPSGLPSASVPADGAASTAPSGSVPPRRRRRVRTRLVVTVVGVVAVASLALSLLAYLLVASSLRAEVLDRAVEEARFVVEVLAVERLGPEVAPGDVEASGLAADLQRRDLDVYIDLGGGEDYVSGLEVVNAPEVVSAEVRELIAAGRIAAERVEVDGVTQLVVGARRPPAGPDLYLFTDVGDTENALRQLRFVLLGASLLLVLVAGVVGWRAGRLTGSLAAAVDELTAARDRERRFVADVSHELRTPVTALVQEAAELAGEVERMPPSTRRVVELLDGDVRRLRDLVEELLELSRLDAAGDTAEAELGELDLVRFLDAVVAQRGVDATVRAPAGSRVRTDRRRLERIVGNLLDNARLHADGRSVTVDAEVEGSTLRLVVADRGPGVPDDALATMFDRFSKTDRSRGRAGSGLGLAIVREHARVLGAEVVARNRDGGGLEVEVRVPVTVVPAPDGPGPREPGPVVTDP